MLILYKLNNNSRFSCYSGMLKLLHRLNLSYTRPPYVLAKADSQKQKAFALEFEVLKKAYWRKN